MLVSVIMAIYKEKEEHLIAAIESILLQTYKNIELVIVNDNPLDSILEKYVKSIEDKRVIYTRNDENSGLAASLNKAIHISSGVYIARMDADDISMPDRISKQISFLEKHKDIDILGTNAFIINDAGDEVYEIKNDYTSSYIKAATFFGAPLIHPTVMFRRSVFSKHKLYYNESYKYAQDYELWSRAVFVVKICLLQDMLFKWRDNENRVSNKSNITQHELTRQIHISQIKRFEIIPDDKDVELNEILFHHSPTTIRKLIPVFWWAYKISAINDKKNIFPKKELKRVLAYYYRITCLNSTNKYIALLTWVIFKVRSYI